MGYKLSQEEKEWRQNKVKELNGELRFKTVEDLKLCEEYEQIFGRKISVTGLYSGLSKLMKEFLGETSVVNNRNSKKQKGLNGEKSNYLVYVKGIDTPWAGFETEEEVTSFLAKSGILGNVAVFKKAPVKIDYKVTIE